MRFAGYVAVVKMCLLFLALMVGRAQSAPDYVLHEWGTFTTVSGSDGGLLPGLQREEEALPPFVFSHEEIENQGEAPVPRLFVYEMGEGKRFGFNCLTRLPSGNPWLWTFRNWNPSPNGSARSMIRWQRF